MDLVEKLEARAKACDPFCAEQNNHGTWEKLYNQGTADLRDLLEAAAKRIRQLENEKAALCLV